MKLAKIGSHRKLNKSEITQKHVRCTDTSQYLINRYCYLSKKYKVFSGYKMAKAHLTTTSIFDFTPDELKDINVMAIVPKTVKGVVYLSKKLKELNANTSEGLNSQLQLWIGEKAAGRLSEINIQTGISQSLILRVAILRCLSQIDELEDAFVHYCEDELELYNRQLEEYSESVKTLPAKLDKHETEFTETLKTKLNIKLQNGMSIKEHGKLNLDLQRLFNTWFSSGKIEYNEDTFRCK